MVDNTVALYASVHSDKAASWAAEQDAGQADTLQDLEGLATLPCPFSLQCSSS